MRPFGFLGSLSLELVLIFQTVYSFRNSVCKSCVQIAVTSVKHRARHVGMLLL